MRIERNIEAIKDELVLSVFALMLWLMQFSRVVNFRLRESRREFGQGLWGVVIVQSGTTLVPFDVHQFSGRPSQQL